MLDKAMLKLARDADRSPHPRLQKKDLRHRDFYQGRPQSAPEPSFCFHLEYEFNKSDVGGLGRAFDKERWEINDLMSAIVHRIDPSITSMYEDGGRESRGRSTCEITTRFQGYGQQLAWHALFIAAGKLLATHPVTNDQWYGSDAWEEWFGHYILTRKDGLWLSDGTDRVPSDASVGLLESKNKGLSITGDQKKIMELAGLDMKRGVDRELIVEGRWNSADSVRIRISSALVPPKKAVQFARKLIREEPILAWVPSFQGDENGEEYLSSNKNGYTPWVVCPSGESRLDEHDPYGVSVANLRPHLAQDYSEFCRLIRQDAFGRFWNNNRGTLSLRAQAWGRDDINREYGPCPGLRLLCKSSVLKKVLTKYEKELLLLFNLQRYKKETYRSRGQFSHSIGVVRIDKVLNVEYFKGRVNYPNKSH